jgi:IS5 family transposase
VLRAVLDIALDYSDGSKSEQPPGDPVAMFKALIDEFENQLQGLGYLPMGAQIVDATRVLAPRQRNNDTQKAAVKPAGKIGPEKPAQATQ